MATHLLGIRHHGPGSSRHLLDALEKIKPDIILIEGPPEGEKIISWAGDENMQPPVALLAYVPDNPKQAVFYPFTVFSPEWNALRYGLKNKIPVRFIDMPLVHKLAEKTIVKESTLAAEESAGKAIPQTYHNPISHLAEIDGYADAEEWWEQHFEIAYHPEQVFDAVAASMTALREQLPAKPDNEEVIREAFMRKAIRAAQKEMYTEIVVVCGAWHVPALANMPKQKDDEALIKNLPKTKVETTWIPWTNDRLSFDSGYGAGINSPGWYGHHWHFPNDDGSRWLSHTAAVFRNHKIDISSAHIIEAVRLSNALASLRGLNRPGLNEFNEATQTVMCMGEAVLMQLVWKDLIVGKDIGRVPDNTPQAPIQRDLEQWIKTLRFKISDEEKPLKLDLREENDLRKSVLLHRLLLLDVSWGTMQRTTGKGTFKEEWILQWYPELVIALLEKAPWGNTVESAADKYLEHKAGACSGLDEITALVEIALPAALSSGMQQAMKRMDELAVGTTDVDILMAAFIPLVQISRYGNVRNTDLQTVNLITTSLFYRIVAGIPLSCSGIDNEQAQKLAEKIKEVTRSVFLLEDAAMSDTWKEALSRILYLEQTAAIVQGCVCKILYDEHYNCIETTTNEFSKALSVNNDPAFSADWLEGFLKDSATVLILNDAIWNIIHEWVSALKEETFVQTLPLLRRTFSLFTNVEKQKIAEKAKYGKAKMAAVPSSQTNIDEERGRKVFPVLEQLMGL